MSLADWTVVERPAPPPGSSPMVVRAVMEAPIVTYDESISLDAALEWAVFRRAANSSDSIVIPELRATEEPLTFRIPLAAEQVGDVWVWCASDAVWPDHVSRSTHYTRRRPPVSEIQRMTTAARVDISKGGTKALNTPSPQVFACIITWYAVGDIEAVRDLLLDVRALGALRCHGRGAVLRWEVEPHSDADAWRQRVMPDPTGPHLVAYRAPRWHRRRKTRGYAWR